MTPNNIRQSLWTLWVDPAVGLLFALGIAGAVAIGFVYFSFPGVDRVWRAKGWDKTWDCVGHAKGDATCVRLHTNKVGEGRL